MKRTKRVEIRFTEKEYLRVKRAAKKLKISMSEFFRKLVF